MRAQIAPKLGSPDATFADLDVLRHVDLRGHEPVDTFGAGLLRHRDTGGACRRGGQDVDAIPLFFEAVVFDGVVHVDGGAVWNYPIEVFDVPESRRPPSASGSRT